MATLKLLAEIAAAVALALFGLGVVIGFACAMALPPLTRWSEERARATKPAPRPRVPPMVASPATSSGKGPRPS